MAKFGVRFITSLKSFTQSKSFKKVVSKRYLNFYSINHTILVG